MQTKKEERKGKLPKFLFFFFESRERDFTVLAPHSPRERERERERARAVSIPIVAIVTSLHVIAFIFAVGAERRRSTAKIVPDEYDERTYCVYGTDASTVYGLAAFGLLVVSQTVLNVVTRCLCCGKGLVTGSSTTWTVFFFVFSGTTFLGAEACLLAGSAKNAYHTKYRGIFGADDLSCATLRKGVFAAGAALTLLSLAGSSLYYWAHSKADTGGWEKHRNEGFDMSSSNYGQHEQQQQKTSGFQKV